MRGTFCFPLDLSGKRQLDCYLGIFSLLGISFSLVCFLLPTIKFSLVLQFEVKSNFISAQAQVRNVLLNLIVWVLPEIQSAIQREVRRGGDKGHVK